MVKTRLAPRVLLVLTLFATLLGAADARAQTSPPADAKSQPAEKHGGSKSARADEKRARAHFEQGRLAVSEARYSDALLHFERSYDLSHKAPLLFNIANALDRLRRDEEAIAKYEQYLAELPAAENRPQVEGRLEVLRHDVETRQAALAATQSPVVTAPTAQEVAAAQLATDTTPSAPVAPQSETRPLYKKWWVWTAVGATVVAAVVVGVVVASDNKEKQQGPLLVNSMTRQVEL